MRKKSFFIPLMALMLQSAPSFKAQQLNPLGVCYVEVNNNNMLNAGSYTLQNTNRQLFDVAIIFAANINYDVSKNRAYISNNNNVTKVLNDVNTYVKPLQQKGIKVLLDLLGNHQGAGISNFPDRAAAKISQCRWLILFIPTDWMGWTLMMNTQDTEITEQDSLTTALL